MILVSGKLYLRPGTREKFLAGSMDAMKQARQIKECRDFVVAADPIEPERVNVFEEWESESALEAFRGDGPGEDLAELIVDAEMSQREVP